MKDFWKLLEKPPAGCDAVASLFDWSTNCDHPTPAAVFSDLIGVSDDEFGTRLADPLPDMGYMELSKLGEALIEYSDRPDLVRDFTRDLLSADG